MAENEDGAALTYENIKGSEAYQEAKTLISKGDFEGALEAIQGLLESTLTQLSDECPDEAELELHEALAPLQYLYGTTLLYSVEESSSDQDAAVPATDDGGDCGGEGNDGNASDLAVINQALLPSSSSSAQENNDGPGVAKGEEGDPAAAEAAAATAEDLQIAWENLESARTILCRISEGKDDQKDRKLDLAQVHLRLGDLQRLNGNYRSAESDYESCLRLRHKFLTYDRKVADVRHSLGMICTLIVADSVRLQQEQQKQTGGPSNSDDVGQRHLTPDQLNHYRKKAILHYLQCGRDLAGLIVLEYRKGTSSPSNTSPGSNFDLQSIDQTLASWIEGHDVLDAGEDKKVSAQHLSLTAILTASSVALKRYQEELTKTLGSVQPNDEVKDLLGVLDEIKETVDTAEDDAQGIRDVAEMKAAAVAAATAEPQTFEGKENGAETTIGFGEEDPTAATPPPTTVVVGRKKRAKPSSDQSSARETQNGAEPTLAAADNITGPKVCQGKQNSIATCGLEGSPTAPPPATLIPVRKKRVALQVSSAEEETKQSLEDNSKRMRIP